MNNDLTHLSKKVVAAESNKQQHQTAKNTCILLLIHNLEAIVLVDRFVIVGYNRLNSLSFPCRWILACCLSLVAAKTFIEISVYAIFYLLSALYIL